MNNELTNKVFDITVKGEQDFMGKKIKIMEGGFGENQRIITVKDVCEIHEARTDKINELILNNIDEFEEGVDIINMTSTENLLNLAKGLGLITNNRQKNCYILSEQGYMLLTSFMKTDKAKEVRKQFRREYFAMREVIQSDEQKLAKLCLQLYKGGQDAVIASQEITKIEVEKATKPLIEKNEVLQIENDKQKDEILTKTEMITGLTDNIDIYTKRDIVNRVIKRQSKSNGGNYQGRYNEMYNCFRETYHIDLRARTEGYNAKQTKKKDQLSIIKYAEQFNHIDGLYQVACKLYGTEVKQLLKELGKIVC